MIDPKKKKNEKNQLPKRAVRLYSLNTKNYAGIVRILNDDDDDQRH